MIGLSFASEVEAAGLMGAPFGWGEDGEISGRENLTPAQNTALDAVIAAHDPSAPAPDRSAEAVDAEIAASPALRGLVRLLAASGLAGMPATEAEIVAAIKAAAP